MKAQKEIKFIDGFSESVWKSLVVKSLRIGWVDGLNQASYRLSKSTMQSLLTAGIFEDLFPGSLNELNVEYNEIKNGEYYELCKHQTHHGRNYSNAFCDMESEAVKEGRSKGYGIMINYVAPNTDLKWLNPRVNNCLYTWYKIKPTDEGKTRNVLELDFKGIPDCVIDGHTYEGKQLGRSCLLLSGHYENHRKIGEIVMKNGWNPIIEEFKKQPIHEIKKTTQIELF